MKITTRILGILAAIVLVVVGLSLELPAKHVSVSSSSSAYYMDWSKNTGAEYLGGDCYNYIVEASLKAGYMSGLMTVKAIAVIGGVLLFFLSLFSLTNCRDTKKMVQAIKEQKEQNPSTVWTPTKEYGSPERTNE